LLDLPFSQDQIVDACVEVVRRNDLGACYLRPIAWMGDGAMGLSARNPVHVAIAAWKWGAYLGDEGLKNGIRAKVSSLSRMHVNASMVKGKITGQYVNSILAKREAVLAGYDEAILLDTTGFVAEASGENIFCVRDGVIRTPPAAQSPVLPGITRDSLIRLAEELGHEVRERTFTRDWMYIADELFLCGTAAEVTPVREVDDRTVGDGRPGPITRALQEAFFAAVRGEDPRFHGWLTWV
jgi:branched-chain amino acid aminotransferase